MSSLNEMPGPQITHKSNYEGSTHPKYVSWLVRCYLKDGPKIALDTDPSRDSIRIQKEIVDTCLEYVANKMLLYIDPRDMLLAADGEITKRIVEPDVGNGQKYWFYPLPEFNEDSFPFIISSGYEMFKIVNVKTGTM